MWEVIKNSQGEEEIFTGIGGRGGGGKQNLSMGWVWMSSWATQYESVFDHQIHIMWKITSQSFFAFNPFTASPHVIPCAKPVFLFLRYLKFPPIKCK